ncbi:MAG: glycosyltransferase family 4 protein [Terracidiphilus sp.]
MKILHVISSGGMYGAEAVILNMSRTLNEGPHRSLLGVFLNSSRPNLQLHESAAREGIESHLIPCGGQIDRAVIARIRELVSKTEVDVVHAHGYKADIYVYLALRGQGIPLVSTCHTWYDNDLMVRLYGAADRYVLRKYSRVVAVSDDVKQRLLHAGVREENICLIKNGIDLRPFDSAVPSLRKNQVEQGIAVVGLVGRLAPEKGVDVFLTAAERVLSQRKDVKFVVAGDGPDRTELESLIDKLGIRAGVTMLGRCDDMPSFYASLDIMVSSSRHEGLPIAILEGMASRLPLIATPVGAIPTVIKDGLTGALVPAENPELLAMAIMDLLRDSIKREKLGGAARRLIEADFSAARMAADYLRVYEDAVAASEIGTGHRVGSSLAPRGTAK